MAFSLGETTGEQDQQSCSKDLSLNRLLVLEADRGCVEWIGDRAAPHVSEDDSTWTLGLCSFQDPEKKNVQYGRPCILQCSWDGRLREVRPLTDPSSAQ